MTKNSQFVFEDKHKKIYTRFGIGIRFRNYRSFPIFRKISEFINSITKVNNINNE